MHAYAYLTVLRVHYKHRYGMYVIPWGFSVCMHVTYTGYTAHMYMLYVTGNIHTSLLYHLLQ
jgi:hypothetical protein